MGTGNLGDKGSDGAIRRFSVFFSSCRALEPSNTLDSLSMFGPLLLKPDFLGGFNNDDDEFDKVVEEEKEVEEVVEEAEEGFEDSLSILFEDVESLVGFGFGGGGAFGFGMFFGVILRFISFLLLTLLLLTLSISYVFFESTCI